jgi:phosphoserine phosphatase RsbU/P
MPFGFRSFTTRLIVWVLAACGAVFLSTLSISQARARATAIRGAEREAVSEATGAIRGIEEVLRSVERSTQLVGDPFKADDSAPVAVEPLLRGFLSTHRDVFGSTIAFRTDRPGGPLAPYVYRRTSGSTSLDLVNLASPDYRYWEREWFTIPAKTGEARWSEPYMDEGGGDVLMVTYSVPVKNDQGALDAIVTADLDLAWLNRLTGTIHAGRTGFGMIVSREGRILGHPDPQWVGGRGCRSS